MDGPRSLVPKSLRRRSRRGRDRTLLPGCELLESRIALAGSLVGSIFDDYNRDGVRQPEEPGLPGRAVFLDLDGDGRKSAGDPAAVTDADGTYRFDSLDPGRYSVHLVHEPGSTLTNPLPPADVVGTPIPVYEPGDAVFDPKRDQLLIPAGDGRLRRFDVVTGSELPAWQVGGQLQGGDISPDGSFVLVGDTVGSHNYLRWIDLETGQVQVLGTGRRYFIPEAVIGGDGPYIVSVYGDPYPNLSLLNLEKESFVELPSVSGDPYRFKFQRSADRSMVRLVGMDWDGASYADYSLGDRTFGPAVPASGQLGQFFAVSASGALGAWWGYGTARVVTASGEPVARLDDRSGACAFDPVRRLLYVAERGSNRLIAYDIDTWRERFSFALPSWLLPEPPFGETWELRVSDDGEYLAFLAPKGVQLYRLGAGGIAEDVVENATSSGPGFGLAGSGLPSGASASRIDVSSGAVVEGDGGENPVVTFTVSLSAPVDRPVSVDYATEDLTAAAGIDYEQVSGSLTFAPGETTKTITVRVLSDWEIEPGELFHIELTNPRGAAIRVDSYAVGAIKDDDRRGVFRLDGGEYRIDEEAGFFEVTVTRTDGLAAYTISAEWYRGHADGASDRFQVPLAFAGGESSKVLRLPVDHNPQATGIENGYLSLASPPYYDPSYPGQRRDILAGASIRFHDAEQDDLVSIRLVPRELEEGSELHTEWLDVRLDRPSRLPVSVSYSTESSRYWSGREPLRAEGILTFAPGETTARLPVPVDGDLFVSQSPSLTVTLLRTINGRLANEYAPGYPVAYKVPVKDDDHIGAVQFARTLYTAAEDGGKVDVELVRTDGISGEIAVRLFAADGTAVAGRNYGAPPGRVVFADGETRKTVSIPVLRDGVVGPDRAFSLGFEPETPGAAYGENRTAMVVVSNSDLPPKAPSDGGGAAPEPPPRVTATGVSGRFVGGKLVSIRLTFDGLLDPTTAVAVASYRLVPIVAGRKEGKPIPLARSSYDAASRSVVLTLRKPLKFVGSLRPTTPGLLGLDKRGVTGRADVSFRAVPVPGNRAVVINY